MYYRGMSRPLKTYSVYILTNRSGTLYVGVTNDLERRMVEHASGDAKTFTGRYALDRLVYVEEYPEVRDAIRREKQLKGWRRSKKVALVNKQNPSWRDVRAGDRPAALEAA